MKFMEIKEHLNLLFYYMNKRAVMVFFLSKTTKLLTKMWSGVVENAVQLTITTVVMYACMIHHHT